HELSFEHYHALGPGEAFMLVNDHDPQPLYYQFDAEHTDEFTWEYTEEGPTVWQVRIGRSGAWRSRRLAGQAASAYQLFTRTPGSSHSSSAGPVANTLSNSSLFLNTLFQRDPSVSSGSMH